VPWGVSEGEACALFDSFFGKNNIDAISYEFLVGLPLQQA